MKMNDDAIRRALRQAPPPPLPEGFTLRLMERVREAIAEDRFLDFRKEFYAKYDMSRNF